MANLKSVKGGKVIRYARHMPLDKYIHERLAMLPGPNLTISNWNPEYPPKQENERKKSSDG